MDKRSKLRDILKNLRSVVIAYSGGLDSTFLLKVAIDTIGKDNVLAVTARSETYPYSEYKEARRLAKTIGARHITIYTKELGIKKFKNNPVNRCYYCKRELFRKLTGLKRRYGLANVIDGTNYDDLKDIRYGRKAAEELGVRNPLLETGIGKADIRRFSRKLKLPTWDKPSFACLASRFPFHTNITKSALRKVYSAEEFVRSVGAGQVRVRAHGETARIEVTPADFKKIIEHRDAIVNRLKKMGFVYIVLDLAGYRTGSMHEMISE